MDLDEPFVASQRRASLANMFVDGPKRPSAIARQSTVAGIPSPRRFSRPELSNIAVPRSADAGSITTPLGSSRKNPDSLTGKRPNRIGHDASLSHLHDTPPSSAGGGKLPKTLLLALDSESDGSSEGEAELTKTRALLLGHDAESLERIHTTSSTKGSSSEKQILQNAQLHIDYHASKLNQMISNIENLWSPEESDEEDTKSVEPDFSTYGAGLEGDKFTMRDFEKSLKALGEWMAVRFDEQSLQEGRVLEIEDYNRELDGIVGDFDDWLGNLSRAKKVEKYTIKQYCDQLRDNLKKVWEKNSRMIKSLKEDIMQITSPKELTIREDIRKLQGALAQLRGQALQEVGRHLRDGRTIAVNDIGLLRKQILEDVLNEKLSPQELAAQGIKLSTPMAHTTVVQMDTESRSLLAEANKEIERLVGAMKKFLDENSIPTTMANELVKTMDNAQTAAQARVEVVRAVEEEEQEEIQESRSEKTVVSKPASPEKPKSSFEDQFAAVDFSIRAANQKPTTPSNPEQLIIFAIFEAVEKVSKEDLEKFFDEKEDVKIFLGDFIKIPFYANLSNFRQKMMDANELLRELVSYEVTEFQTPKGRQPRPRVQEITLIQLKESLKMQIEKNAAFSICVIVSALYDLIFKKFPMENGGHPYDPWFDGDMVPANIAISSQAGPTPNTDKMKPDGSDLSTQGTKKDGTIQFKDAGATQTTTSKEANQAGTSKKPSKLRRRGTLSSLADKKTVNPESAKANEMRNKAATKIQSLWRMYIMRKRYLVVKKVYHLLAFPSGNKMNRKAIGVQTQAAYSYFDKANQDDSSSEDDYYSPKRVVNKSRDAAQTKPPARKQSIALTKLLTQNGEEPIGTISQLVKLLPKEKPRPWAEAATPQTSSPRRVPPRPPKATNTPKTKATNSVYTPNAASPESADSPIPPASNQQTPRSHVPAPTSTPLSHASHLRDLPTPASAPDLRLLTRPQGDYIAGPQLSERSLNVSNLVTGRAEDKPTPQPLSEQHNVIINQESPRTIVNQESPRTIAPVASHESTLQNTKVAPPEPVTREPAIQSSPRKAILAKSTANKGDLKTISTAGPSTYTLEEGQRTTRASTVKEEKEKRIDGDPAPPKKDRFYVLDSNQSAAVSHRQMIPVNRYVDYVNEFAAREVDREFVDPVVRQTAPQPWISLLKALLNESSPQAVMLYDGQTGWKLIRPLQTVLPFEKLCERPYCLYYFLPAHDLQLLMKDRDHIHEYHMKRAKAAIKIQKVYRGYKSRKRYSFKKLRTRKMNEYKRAMVKVMKAIDKRRFLSVMATIIQKVYRGYRVRKVTQVPKPKSINYRMVASSREKSRAALIKINDNIKRRKAAIKIQSLFRGFWVRKHVVPKVKLERKVQMKEIKAFATTENELRRKLMAILRIQSYIKKYVRRRRKVLNKGDGSENSPYWIGPARLVQRIVQNDHYPVMTQSTFGSGILKTSAPSVSSSASEKIPGLVEQAWNTPRKPSSTASPLKPKGSPRAHIAKNTADDTDPKATTTECIELFPQKETEQAILSLVDIEGPSNYSNDKFKNGQRGMKGSKTIRQENRQSQSIANPPQSSGADPSMTRILEMAHELRTLQMQVAHYRSSLQKEHKSHMQTRSLLDGLKTTSYPPSKKGPITSVPALPVDQPPAIIAPYYSEPTASITTPRMRGPGHEAKDTIKNSLSPRHSPSLHRSLQETDPVAMVTHDMRHQPHENEPNTDQISVVLAIPSADIEHAELEKAAPMFPPLARKST
eukprot:TRINITY_DN6500_c0_g1_i2.p1 TRINITY_DN6500_c0_g1~~TRINITY_DN6500_c0_g1_i2.p1  ORF type:complete len:1752 (+),score=345.31 TRINITY_DN6500_c0_g1_i2:120-5375(+)